MKRGVFISFEGTEGCGKSTQMRLLCERLRAEGHSVVLNQEPGGTHIGQQIRRILLNPENVDLAASTELLLMFASRAQAANEVIEPALRRGSIVLSDRFTDSTLAYQGKARGLGFELVRRAHQIAVGDLMPDLSLCIDVDIAEGLARASRRNDRQTGPDESRIDRQAIAFHEAVREGYLAIAAEEPVRFKLVDGGGTVEQVAERVWAAVGTSLTLANGA